ncbi:DUF2207 domain-containing protein [Mariniluteicoccus flavus]
MTFLIFLLLGLVVVGLVVLHGRASSAGRQLISRHDTLYAGVPPGTLPPALDGPTRPATGDDVNTVVAVRFDPPQGMRPEQVGMVTDAKVGSPDIAAAMIALAVEGFVHLRRLPPSRWSISRRPKPEWLVTVNRLAGPEEIGPFRAALLQALTSLDRPATITELKPFLAQVVPGLKKSFAAEPQHAAWYPNLRAGSLPVSAMFGPGARARSALGSALRYQSAAFKLFLEKADGDRLRFEAGAGVFSRFLPWAVAYGVTDQWIHAFQEAAAGADPGLATYWAADLAWFGDFGAFDGLDLDSFGDAMGDFGDAIGDLGDGLGDLASDLSSDVGDAGGGSDGGGDGGGGDGGGGGGD